MTRANPDATALSANRKRELLARAHDLCAELVGGQVGRSELGLVLAVLFKVHGPWDERVDEARQLVEALPFSGLVKRDKNGLTGRKFQHLAKHISVLLKGLPSADELRFLLGWTDRLLKIREVEAQEKRRAERRARSSRSSRHG